MSVMILALLAVAILLLIWIAIIVTVTIDFLCSNTFLLTHLVSALVIILRSVIRAYISAVFDLQTFLLTSVSAVIILRYNFGQAIVTDN